MTPDLPPSIPIEIIAYDMTDINRMAQVGTKEYAPWWWNKYGCKGTQWYGPEPCRDLTK